MAWPMIARQSASASRVPDDHPMAGRPKPRSTGPSGVVRPGRACAVDHRVVERVGHGTARALRHRYDQDRLCGVQAAPPRPGQQSTEDGGVLGGALGQGERDLGAVQGDAEGDHTAVLSHPDPVDHERHQVQAGQVDGEQLGHGMLGPGDERRETADLEVPAGYSICTPARRGSGSLITKARKAGRHLIVSSQMAGASGPRLKTYRLCIAAVCAPK
jgi:hypothetical protein